MKIFWISLISSIAICIIYHVATYEFKIPFIFTIAVGLIMFILIFFVLFNCVKL